MFSSVFHCEFMIINACYASLLNKEVKPLNLENGELDTILKITSEEHSNKTPSMDLILIADTYLNWFITGGFGMNAHST